MSESPSLLWLADRLGELSADRDLALWHARRIRTAVLSLLGRNDRCGHKLEKGRRVREATRGPRRELEELRRAAHRATKHNMRVPWMEVWAAVSEKTRVLVWQPAKPPVITKFFDASGRMVGFQRGPVRGAFSFHAAGWAMLAPYPRDALPLIDAALRRLQATPATRRRARTSDKLVAELAIAIKAAYAELGGSRLPKPVLRENAKLDSPVIALARDIDERFGLGVFSATDSPRLRNLSNF